MINIIDLLQRQLNKCSPAEKKVATFILENRDTIKSMSAKELSIACDASPAAVIRLCKRIGIDSFKILKEKLSAEESDSTPINPELPILTSETELNSSAVLQTIVEQNIKALSNTQKTLNYNAVEKALEFIMNSSKVCFFGMSESSLVAMDAYYKFLRINESVFFSQDSHIAMMIATNMKENDVLFLISLSGQTKEVLELIQVAKRKRLKVILLTEASKSSAARLSDVVLTTSKEEGNLRMGTMVSRMTQLIVIDLLFMEICNRRGTNVINYIIDTHNTVQRIKR